MHRITRRIAIGLVAAGALAGSFTAGVAYAADGRFDLADQNIEKAILLLKAAENPNAKHPKIPFGGHRWKAVKALEIARKEIVKAKAYADNPKHQKGNDDDNNKKKKKWKKK